MAKIIDIEGIGEAFRDKLTAAGIATTDALLERGATPKGRETLAADTGISPKLILTWINHADLYRIKGIGSEYADLLEAATRISEREDVRAVLIKGNGPHFSLGGDIGLFEGDVI